MIMKQEKTVIFGLDIANYDDNVGQISLVKDTYGFIVNAKYPSGIYFVNFGEFKKGDKVTFKVIRKYDKPRAINLRLIEETECQQKNGRIVGRFSFGFLAGFIGLKFSFAVLYIYQRQGANSMNKMNYKR